MTFVVMGIWVIPRGEMGDTHKGVVGEEGYQDVFNLQ